MNILIIEDEKPAAEKLSKALKKINPLINIAGVLSSVQEAKGWFAMNEVPELVLMDIQLTDGTCFDILRQNKITSPVIFITAHDEYLLEAFKFNGIDYLLKPVKLNKLELAINKYQRLKNHFTNYALLLQQYSSINSIKQRLLVKKGIEFISFRIEEAAYFFTEHKIVFLVDNKGNKYIVDKPLFLLEGELDAKTFFRANRKYLVNINFIRKFKALAKGKILLEIFPAPNEDIIISQENASAFKRWMRG